MGMQATGVLQGLMGCKLGETGDRSGLRSEELGDIQAQICLQEVILGELYLNNNKIRREKKKRSYWWAHVLKIEFHLFDLEKSKSIFKFKIFIKLYRGFLIYR